MPSFANYFLSLHPRPAQKIGQGSGLYITLSHICVGPWETAEMSRTNVAVSEKPSNLFGLQIPGEGDANSRCAAAAAAHPWVATAARELFSH